MNRAMSVCVLVGASRLLAQCPPGTFDYGPALEIHPELIVLAHYGANDPLVPAPADYQRAARDVGLINTAIPATVGQVQGLYWDPSRLLIITTNPTQELVCANQFYQAAMYYLCCNNAWIVVFPRNINMDAAEPAYRAIPGVLAADRDLVTGEPCFDDWSYRVDAAGNWRWHIVEAHQVPTPKGVFCFSEGTWDVITTPAGEITVLCYANCDESTAAPTLNVNDFACFLNRFAAGEPYANCDGSPLLNVADLACFLNRFAAGCS